MFNGASIISMPKYQSVTFKCIIFIGNITSFKLLCKWTVITTVVIFYFLYYHYYYFYYYYYYHHHHYYHHRYHLCHHYSDYHCCHHRYHYPFIITIIIMIFTITYDILYACVKLKLKDSVGREGGSMNNDNSMFQYVGKLINPSESSYDFTYPSYCFLYMHYDFITILKGALFSVPARSICWTNNRVAITLMACHCNDNYVYIVKIKVHKVRLHDSPWFMIYTILPFT